MAEWLKPSLNWLLIFVPISVALEFLKPEAHTLIFFTAALAIIPLAGWLGQATEHLAEHVGEGVGGLLNATFGNAAELIIGFLALKKGLYAVVKASITGSIVGNLLLVLGAAFLAGGIKEKRQQFNATAARSQSSSLFLAAVAMLLPATFHHLTGATGKPRLADLSTEIAIVLLITYALSLWFSLHTHKQLFEGESKTANDSAPVSADKREEHWSIRKSLLVLGASTAMVAGISEILVGAVEPTAQSLGMTSIFVGVIIVAIVGNAAEHSTAILMARQNRMDLTIGIAVGSSVQVALFVAPVLLLLSHIWGPRPMDLVFSPAEVLAVAISCIIVSQVTGDGESNWLEGAQLLAVYVLLGIVFFFLPEQDASAHGG